MDSDLLFNISLTLSRIRGSLNYSGGTKLFMPVFCRFRHDYWFLIFQKVFYPQKSTIKTPYFISYEIIFLMLEVIDNIEFLFNTQNDILEERGGLTLRNYVAMTYVCFDKFFSEMVSSLKDEQFITLTKIYSTVRRVDNSCSTLASLLIKHDDATGFTKKIHYLFSELIPVYVVCDKFLNKFNYIYHPMHLDIALKLNIKGLYVEYLKKTEKSLVKL